MSKESFVNAHHIRVNIQAKEYRQDIDSIRAIAIISVLIFHTFPTVVPGGFVGVDIFFVISGYLISKNIFRELNANTFSIYTFYIRRIKRIFPSLIFVLFTSTIIGWIVLTPNEYELFGLTIAGGSGFVANFIFWQQSGYFDTAANTKPLLHLWSLGIEEQFYIVWPFILMAIWHRIPNKLIKIIVGITFASFIYSLWLLIYDNSVAAFYSPLARFWELGLGAIVGYSTLRTTPVFFGDLLRNILAWIGLALITISVISIKKTEFFPGLWALLPTTGAACLIYSGNSYGNANAAWLNRIVLTNRLLVFIGLISYPLYLWHWMLWSFTYIMESRVPGGEVRLILIGISLVLAWVSYRFIELPIRSIATDKAKKIILILSSIMAFMLAIGITIHKFDGFKFRVLWNMNGDLNSLTTGADRQMLLTKCGVPETQQHLVNMCFTDAREPPTFAVMGDSKAEVLYYGLARESHAGMRGMLIGSVNTRQQFNANSRRAIMQQKRNRLAFQTLLTNPSIRVVVLVNALRSMFSVDKDTGFINGTTAPEVLENWHAEYNHVIKLFEQAGKRVIFVIDNPTLPDPFSCISGGLTSSQFLNQFLRRKPNPYCAIRYTDHLSGTLEYRQFIAKLMASNPRLVIYDTAPWLCNIPNNKCSIISDGKFLYSYSDHISDYASSLIAKDLIPIIEKLGVYPTNAKF